VKRPDHLFRVIRAGFGQRRKTLRNALRQAGWPAAGVASALVASGIVGTRRGETLSLEEFGRLAQALPEAEPRAESREPTDPLLLDEAGVPSPAGGPGDETLPGEPEDVR
jgi:hypothetical protein